MILLAAPLFDDHPGFGCAIKPPGISKILPKGSMKTFVSSILPELTVGNATGAEASFFKNVVLK